MTVNVLITGGSGYLGGSLLSHLKTHPESTSGSQIYALVRTQDQAELVTQHYDARPLMMDLSDEAIVTRTLLELRISIVFYLINASRSDDQLRLIRALRHVEKSTGLRTHLLHTTGAKMFSTHVGFPTSPNYKDDDKTLFDVLAASRSAFPAMQKALDTNLDICRLAEEQDVRSYFFIPCFVYGRGDGFGNPISIQSVAIVKAAKAAGRLYRVDANAPTWPVCHISDNTSLYAQILHNLIHGKAIPCGRNGFYLASSGLIAWDDIYQTIAKQLTSRGVIETDIVEDAGDEALQIMADALGCPKPFVAVSLGGLSTLGAQNGSHIGWKPKHSPEHALTAMGGEVDLILQHI